MTEDVLSILLALAAGACCGTAGGLGLTAGIQGRYRPYTSRTFRLQMLLTVLGLAFMVALLAYDKILPWS